MSWPNNARVLSQQLGIQYPIIQAPMVGGVTTPELVAAVSNAGGLGSLGAGYLEPEALRQNIRAVRELTERPFAVNVFVPQAVTEDAERIMRGNEILARYRHELALPDAEPLVASLPDYTEQLGVLFEEAVRIVSFTFGVPSPGELESLQQSGVITIGTATHLLEAIVLEESGIDIVVAQGFEAGGPRATFIGSFEQAMVGSMVLIPLLVDHLRVPIVAAGGITDERHIMAALALGAAGVQPGTAFLSCPESGAHQAYKAKLSDSNEIITGLSRVFSGKPARGLKNRLTEELREVEAFLPGYPLQNALTREITQAAAEQDNPEFMPLWAGQGCGQISAEPAAELIARWVERIEAR